MPNELKCPSDQEHYGGKLPKTLLPDRYWSEKNGNRDQWDADGVASAIDRILVA
jgi:hypothetical protein